jgi:hypothetical protein
MIIGPYSSREYWHLRQMLDAHFPHTVNLQKGPYVREHDMAMRLWCTGRMIGGNGLYFVDRLAEEPSRMMKDAMIDTAEHWCAYMRLWSFKDPNIAFEFKLRFG